MRKLIKLKLKMYLNFLLIINLDHLNNLKSIKNIEILSLNYTYLILIGNLQFLIIIFFFKFILYIILIIIKIFNWYNLS
jgi:hypothetical protein